MSDPRHPVAAICMEVASPDLMEQWLAAGWMPQLARLRAEGAWCRLRSVVDVSSGSVWPSFVTGLMPARHGQFFTHMQLQPGSYRIVKRYADNLPREPFWAALAPAGMSAAIIDVPQTRPLPAFRGVHLVGWGGEYPAWPRSSAPPSLMPEILRRFGPHPLAETRRIAARPESEAACARLAADLLEGARTKAAISRLVLERGPFDFFLTVFAETHWAMHLLWDTLDETHPLHDPARARRHAGVFRDILGTIDDLLGEVRARLPEAAVLAFSLSGMGPNHSGWHFLPEVLARLGMGPPSGEANAVPVWSPLRRWGPWALRRAERLIPSRLIEAAKLATPDRLWDVATRRLFYAGSGWAESRAFQIPNDQTGAIRINVRGREPAGRVEPGAEYDAVCAEITLALLGLVDAGTGRPVVAEVIRVQEAFRGERLDDLPDLLVVWTGDAPVEAVRSARLGEIRLASPERRTGAHRPWGFFAAAGRRVAPGVTGRDGHVVDLAPTILQLLDLEPPSDGDGRVLQDLLRLDPDFA